MDQRSDPLNRDPALQAPEAPAMAEPSSDDQRRPGALEALILKRLDEDKAQDVVFIDLKDKSSVADTDRNFWMSAEQAVAYGLAGKIINRADEA